MMSEPAGLQDRNAGAVGVAANTLGACPRRSIGLVRCPQGGAVPGGCNGVEWEGAA